MNTKTTSYKWAHNFYDGGNHALGRDSPGALLDMLAEVASQTLHSESIKLETKNEQKGETVRRKNQEVCLDLRQILSMPLTQLVKHFSIFTSDELKRQYSYACALVPDCQQKYTSFASEGKARISITIHLADHLDHLRNNQDFYETFKASAVKYPKSKSGVQSKKQKGQQQCGKKPQEIPNKENKLVKSEKSTSYLRKILCNEMNFKEFEREKKAEEADVKENSARWPMEMRDKSDIKVLGDHSYYEHVKEETGIDDNADENIMLMVAENDEHTKPCTSDDTRDGSNPEYTAAVTAKPKGKAKFIGTSKEEREMALVLIERIKKKGNPTGSNLQCRICDPPRTFTAPTTLVSHYRSHAGIKPYECRICRSVFTRRHSLKYHMLIHQNQTRFTCADCGKKFRHPSHFREHRRRHTGESPFGCDDCGQRFKTRNTYKRHLKTRHGKVLTTTGELLCLTEEEFEKVQTNRKRKSSSISSDYLADVDATRTIVQFVNDVYTSEIDNHENNGDTMSIEDYAVQEEIFVSPTENPSVDKTDETIETEVLSESNDDFYEIKDEDNDRILYDGMVVEHGALVESSIDPHDECEVVDKISHNVLILDNLAAINNEEDICEIDNNEYATVDIEYDDQNSTVLVDEDNGFAYNCRAEVTGHVGSSEDNIVVVGQNDLATTRVNVQYAFEIRENARQLLSEQITQDNSQNYDETMSDEGSAGVAYNIECPSSIDEKSLSCYNNNNETEDIAVFSDESKKCHDSTTTIIVPTVANNAFR